MARDLELAADIVKTVLDELMTTWLGDAVGPMDDLIKAAGYAVVEVADILDPDEAYDVEVIDVL